MNHSPIARAGVWPFAAVGDRLAVFDLLKALASQLIVLHHLVAYGPLADAFRERFPALADRLYYDGRLAVQVFFVIGGYLAARALAPALQPRALSVLPLLWRRYRRLALPMMVAVLCSMVCAAIARALIDDPSLPAVPTVGQVLAHALLMHDLFGVEALSAGVWYVAIDFQLFALLAVVAACAARYPIAALRPAAMASTVAVLAALSLFLLNRHPELDVVGPYFFGVYALGAAVYWLAPPARALWWGIALVALVLLALQIEHRERLAFAGIVALSLWVGLRTGVLSGWPEWPLAAFLGRISFSVFLIHYPVIMLVNALTVCLFGTAGHAPLYGLLSAWAASLVAGALFHRHVEQPLARLA